MVAQRFTGGYWEKRGGKTGRMPFYEVKGRPPCPTPIARMRRVRLSDYARVLLASIRLLNGGLALLAPGFLARQVGVNPESNPGITYVFRMFGIRTVLIGAEL